jgi:hypothetical protein
MHMTAVAANQTWLPFAGGVGSELPGDERSTFSGILSDSMLHS